MRAHRAEFPVVTMARVLGVSRSGFYAWLKRRRSGRSKADGVLAERIRAIHERSRGTYGAPRIQAELADEGVVASRKRVARLMREAGLTGASRRRKPGTHLAPVRASVRFLQNPKPVLRRELPPRRSRHHFRVGNPPAAGSSEPPPNLCRRLDIDPPCQRVPSTIQRNARCVTYVGREGQRHLVHRPLRQPVPGPEGCPPRPRRGRRVPASDRPRRQVPHSSAGTTGATTSPASSPASPAAPRGLYWRPASSVARGMGCRLGFLASRRIRSARVSRHER